MRTDSVKELLSKMITSESTMATIFYGEAVSDEEREEIEAISEVYPDLCIQTLNGGQKIYSYIIEVE